MFASDFVSGEPAASAGSSSPPSERPPRGSSPVGGSPPSPSVSSSGRSTSASSSSARTNDASVSVAPIRVFIAWSESSKPKSPRTRAQIARVAAGDAVDECEGHASIPRNANDEHSENMHARARPSLPSTTASASLMPRDSDEASGCALPCSSAATLRTSSCSSAPARAMSRRTSGTDGDSSTEKRWSSSQASSGSVRSSRSGARRSNTSSAFADVSDDFNDNDAGLEADHAARTAVKVSRHAGGSPTRGASAEATRTMAVTPGSRSVAAAMPAATSRA
mmetsp:Transcript_14328/g.60614  ORF Transcript_14328/g.60614 Transcript_14328/m.60614 type:complete len:279 (-) Transcript_14328:951-1787(-)